MSKEIWKQWAVLVGVVVTIAMNILANALPLNGQNTGEISDRFQVLFVPAGYVFAIWGLIYIGLIAFGVYQALPAQRTNPALMAIRLPFILSCVANVVWLFLWHYNRFSATLLAMLSLLVLLLWIYLRLGIGRASVSTAARWCVHATFSVYLGWITVATIANVTDVLDWIKWSGWGISPEVWAIVMLAVATVVACAMILTRRDVAYALVIVWAFVGIALKQAATRSVAMTAWVTAALIALVIVLVFLRVVGRPALAGPA